MRTDCQYKYAALLWWSQLSITSQYRDWHAWIRCNYFYVVIVVKAKSRLCKGQARAVGRICFGRSWLVLFQSKYSGFDLRNCSSISSSSGEIQISASEGSESSQVVLLSDLGKDRSWNKISQIILAITGIPIGLRLCSNLKLQKNNSRQTIQGSKSSR